MKNSWNKVVALMLAAALCVSCGVTGFAEDTQTDENTEIVEVVEQQNQEEPPKEEAPEPVQEPEPAPVQEEPKEEPAPAPEPVKEPEPAPVPEAPKAEEPKAEPAPAPVTEEPKAESAPEAPKAEEPKADETKKEEETKAEESETEKPKAEESQTEEPKPEEKPVEQPAADDENLIDDQMDGDPAELPEGDGPTVTETEDGTVIDMGETAEEPVEGEDANAEKPAEDGELDEDFTLPEEGELPEEDAEPEIPEIDFSTLQVVIGEPQYDGDVMTLRATLIGFDNIDYALQWQFSTDDATWTDVSGATGDTLVVQLDESNAGCYWRVSAEVFGWKTLPTEQAAQE